MAITANQITNFRIACVPLIAFCICIDSKLWATIGFILFVLAGISDWYDGYLARTTNTTSVFGRVFDSIADKLLVGGSMLALAYVGRFGNALIFPALVILLREIFVAGLREYVIRLQIEKSADEHETTESPQTTLAATDLAKLKTVLQMVGIGMLMIAPYLLHPYFGMVGGLVFWVSAVLSAYTGWQYWQEARPAIHKGLI
ncbi:MAG: CDP-diacylglycerol--glycerol-3-phosphate 3-phosphatidyltransferase [Alphaproteobacteria bacterium]|nr:CDP-diacylglycerol--glycerol-3-phosphate 3-phosphatidyltransferase [Alphaproteobacteria bacterium]